MFHLRDFNYSLTACVFKAAFDKKTILQPNVMVSFFFVHVYQSKVKKKKKSQWHYASRQANT